MVGIDTVDGRNPANQLRFVIYFTPLFTGFYASKVFRKVARWQKTIINGSIAGLSPASGAVLGQLFAEVIWYHLM